MQARVSALGIGLACCVLGVSIVDGQLCLAGIERDDAPRQQVNGKASSDDRAGEFRRFLASYRAEPSRARVPPSLDDLTREDFALLEDEFRSVMAPELAPGHRGQVLLRQLQVGAYPFTYAVRCPTEVPPGQLYPAVVRLGYPPGDPATPDYVRANLSAMYGDVPQDEPIFFFRAGIIDDVFAVPGRVASSEAASLDVFRLSTARWDAFLDDILTSFPVDASRLYVTGKSYEGVQALSVGLHTPDRIAGIAAFSSVVYPFQIYYRYQHALNCKVLVYRGALDHMFTPGQGIPPGQEYRRSEEAFGRRMCEIAPESVLKVWEGHSHEDVYRH